MSKKFEKIFIFDTTLRDGEQSPGASMTVKEKIEFAKQLEKLNVDVIEAGFPISSPGDFESVKQVAKIMTKPSVAGLSRAMQKDIKRCYDAVKFAKHPRIHTFIATSDIHIEHKFKSNRKTILKRAIDAVKYAKSLVKEVEFSAEDASRSNWEYLAEVVEAVIDAGATVINIPDTVGYAIPEEFGLLIKFLMENVSNVNKAILSVHCHNDLGLSTSNAISAITNGVRQIECTINGIGERAGNASLEEIAMILKTRKDFLPYKTGIKTKEIYRTSKLLTKITGLHIQKNKAIVGANAFAHEAGIHQDGVMKHQSTYEIMNPKDIGLPENKFVLGKHSGRHAFIKKLKDLGYSKLNNDDIEQAFNKFKEIADKKKEVFDNDIEAIVEFGIYQTPPTYEIIYLHTTSGSSVTPTATIKIKIKGKKIIEEAATGDGPIDAIYKAIDKIVDEKIKLVDYSISSASSGKDALGMVKVKVKSKTGEFKGQGVGTDIIDASAKAYINAINRINFKKNKK